MTPAAERELLEARARLLARAPVAELRPEDRIELLVFSLSGERYALETSAVREVVRFVDFTLVPGAPAFLLGVTNVRGQILPVFDLRRLAGMAPKGLTDLSRLLVLGHDREELGLLADDVSAIEVMRRQDVLDPPEELAAIGRDLLLGVTRDATTVLDIEALLRDPRLFL
jgi:purine-binding chemotaxis protein CheW